MKFEKKDSFMELDTLLKNALKPVNEPDAQMNRRLLAQIKEENDMRKHKIPAAVLAAFCILLFGSISVAAAVHFLTPSDVAENQGDTRLAAVLEEGNQLSKYESQVSGGYQVTFMGLVSGENITDFPNTKNDEIVSSETYAVAAIEKEDGTSIPENPADWKVDLQAVFFLEGENPCVNRIVNSSERFCKDGVMYCIISSNNIEMFADRTVYLAVYEKDSWVEEQEYIYDEKTGKISRNKSCSRLNALFTVPLDSSKADPEAAEQYLQKPEAETDLDVDNKEFACELITSKELHIEEGQKRLRERSELVAAVPCQVSTTKEGQPYVEFVYETADGYCREGKRAIEDNWEEFPAGTWLFMGYGEEAGENGRIGRAEILHKEEDGSLTMNVFQVMDKE